MASAKLLIFISLGLFAGLCHAAPPEKDERCEYLGKLHVIVRNQIHQISTCARESFPTILRSRSPLCTVKCILTKFGILSDEGTADIEGIDKFIDANIPPVFRSKSLDLVLECQADSEKIDPSDETCKSYEPMLSCFMKGLRTTFQNAASKILERPQTPPDFSQIPERVSKALRTIPCLITVRHLEMDINKLERWIQ